MGGFRRRLTLAGVALLTIIASVSVLAANSRGDATSAAAPAYAGSVTRIQAPAPNSLVSGNQVQIVIRSRASRGSLSVRLNGRVITSRLRRQGGRYTAVVGVGGQLSIGTNLLTVSTSYGGRYDFDDAQFVVARPGPGLVSVQRIRVRRTTAPIVVDARLGRGTTLIALLNGTDASQAFIPQGRGIVSAALSASYGARRGVNRLVLKGYTTTPGRARVTTVVRQIKLPLAQLVPGAGVDDTVLAGQFVRLNGTAKLAPGDRGRSYSWRIVQAPRGSKARLLRPRSSNPGLLPDRPGTYRMELTVTTNPGRNGHAPRRSVATVTLLAQPNDPYGVALESNGPKGAILLGGSTLPDTTRDHEGDPRDLGFSYAVINRTTLKPVVSGQLGPDPDGIKRVLEIAKQYSDGTDVMVFNWKVSLRANRDLLEAAFKQVGGGDLPSDDLFAYFDHPGSVIGVPGAPAGVAYLDHRDGPGPADSGDMKGYLRLNGVTGLFDFVFASYIGVDTAPPAKTSATKSTITVGATDYTLDHPDGVSGFQVLVLDPKTLGLITDREYVTNYADGSSTVSDTNRLANDLLYSADQRDRPLVFVQSYGEPKGTSADWDRAAIGIEKMGGTRQVFDDLNQPYAGGPGSDPTAGRKGGYAFIGRTASSSPRTEVSYPLDGLPARLAGMLMLTRFADFEPMIVAPPKDNGSPPVNEDLIRIANQAPTAFPALAPGATAAQVQAAQDFLGGPAVMGVCQTGVTCDVRQTYSTIKGSSWGPIATALADARGKCQTPPSGVDPGVCERVRSQLFDEVHAGDKVYEYLGPGGLQQPFGAAGVAALANLGEISDQIINAIKPPPQDNTGSIALTVISYAVRIPGVVGSPQLAAVTGGIGAAFALSGYLTYKDNGPNLIGDQVRTAAAQLGVELAKRYQTAGDQLDGLFRLIVTDYGKLTAVAGKVDSDPNWILGQPGAARDALVRAGKQTIAEKLVPLAYPVMYDLGRVYGLNARNWNCFYVVFVTKRKNLFQDEPDGGQVVERFPKNDWTPVIAVGGTDAQGHTDSARIPSPPGSFMDDLFRPPALGGVGMKKLEFYTPRLFRYFRDDPRKGDSVFAWDYETVASPECDRLPNPPGNSG